MGKKKNCYIISLIMIISKLRPTNKRTKVKTMAISDANMVISTSNALFLILGRFVFLPYQRRQAANAGLPKQNRKTHEAAGDYLAKEASIVLQTGDTAGFNVIDVMAWGALGHALGFASLVISQQ